MTNAALPAIETATRGLLYMSETEAPFETVYWPKQGSTLDSADLLLLIGKTPADRVEQIALEEFFQDLTQDQDWHDANEKQVVGRYRNLLAVLKQYLTDLKVFKVGEVEIEVFVVGQTAAGEWTGIKTTAVET